MCYYGKSNFLQEETVPERNSLKYKKYYLPVEGVEVLMPAPKLRPPEPKADEVAGFVPNAGVAVPMAPNPGVVDVAAGAKPEAAGAPNAGVAAPEIYTHKL